MPPGANANSNRQSDNSSANASQSTASTYYPPSTREDPRAAPANPFLQPANRAVNSSSSTTATMASEGKPGTNASSNASYASPANAQAQQPRVVVQSATMYDAPPAAGVPVQNTPQRVVVDQGGTRTVVSTHRGVWHWSSVNYDDPAVRAAVEREFLREYGGGPDGRLPCDIDLFIGARQWSRIVRLFALIDIIMCILYAITGSPYYCVLLLGPILGFIGAKLYSPWLTVCYFFFCFLIIALRLWEFVVDDDITLRVLCIIIVCLEIWIARIIGRFWWILRQIPRDGLVLLRHLDDIHYIEPVETYEY